MSLVRTAAERSRTRRWPRSSSGRWRRRRPTRPTGRSVRWPGKRAVAYDGPADMGGLQRAAASCGDLQLSGDPHFVDKVRDIVGLSLAPPTARWCSVSTRRARSRRSTAHSRSCRCCRACLSAAHTTTSVTARTSLFAALDVATGRVIGKATGATGPGSSRLPEGDRPTRFPTSWTSTSSWTSYATPQDGGSQSLAGTAAALACSLYADFGVVDQSGRTLVRRTDAQATAARRAHLHPPARSRYPGLHRKAQRRPQALQVDQIGRRHPRCRQALLPPCRSKLMPRTLDSGD